MDDGTLALHFVDDTALNYSEVHSEDISSAIQRLKREAVGQLPQSTRLATLLSKMDQVYDLQTHTLPRPLKGTQELKAATIRVGHSSGRIKRILGRGSYGVVALLDDGGAEILYLRIIIQRPCHSFRSPTVRF
jgi:hypothetical protein